MVRKSERLEEIRQDLGLSKADFARLIGIKPNYYTHISTDNGRGNLRVEHLEVLLRKANVNPIWILTGQGDKFIRVSNEIVDPNEPTEEEVNALFDKVVREEGAEFDKSKTYLTKFICAQVIYEFPDAEDIKQLSFAARAYLKAIMRMPTTDFMDILGVRDDLFSSGQEEQLPPKGE